MSDQEQLEPMKITPDMDGAMADIMGVMGFSFAMNKKMTEKRDAGKTGWNKMGSIDELDGQLNCVDSFKERCKKAIDEGRYVDAGNYTMMLFHLERMENNGSVL